MKPIFKKLEDPMSAMTIKHKLRPLANTTDQIEKGYPERANQTIYLKGIHVKKQYEKAVRSLWGQCSSALQTTIKGIGEYEETYDDFDAIWLLTETKKAMSGIDLKANPRLT